MNSANQWYLKMFSTQETLIESILELQVKNV